jgi:hypothetical protein
MNKKTQLTKMTRSWASTTKPFTLVKNNSSWQVCESVKNILALSFKSDICTQGKRQVNALGPYTRLGAQCNHCRFIV